METIRLNLKNIEGNENIDDINEFFFELLLNLQSYLNLKIINQSVKITFIKAKIENFNLFNFGVKKSIRNNTIFIEILDKYKKFLSFILLREAYCCFIPDILKDNESVMIFINQIIENNLQNFDVINDWKSLIREIIVNYNFLVASFDRLEKFLMLQGTEVTENPIIFFFEYIRKNILLINDNSEDLYYNLHKEFLFKTSKSIKNNEIIETIRVLIKIFYKVKSYRALLDFQNYFKKYKQNGEINTDLSLRKFIVNMKWINKFSYIAPSYQINYNALNLVVIVCILRFHPLITKDKVDLIIQKLPFFLNSKSSESYFAIEVSGYIIAPLAYLKDICNFIDKLEQYGFITNKICFFDSKYENNLNLNYFREFYKKGRIINPNNRHYDDKYEIKFTINFGRKFFKQKLSILDYLILDRVRYFSITGFAFERRTETLRALKSDLLNEILSQRALIRELKKNVEVFYKDEDLKNKILTFLDSNRWLGFFYIKELLGTLISGIEIIKTFLIENQNIKNLHQFQEVIKKRALSQSIEKKLLYNEEEVKKVIFQDLIPLYFQNKRKFNEDLEDYQKFYNFFKSCHDLKILSSRSMERLIKDEDLVEKIYSIKEEKLSKNYENSRLKRITSKDVEEIINSFVNSKPPIIAPLLITTIMTTPFAKYYIQLVVKDSAETRKTIDRIKRYFPRVIILGGEEIFSREELFQVEIYLPSLNEKEKELLISILHNLFKDNLISLKRYFYDGFFKAFSRKDFYDFEKQEFFYTKDLFEQYFRYVQKIFSKNLKPFQEQSKIVQDQFWSSEKDIKHFVNRVNDRCSREQVDLNPKKLNELLRIHSNLKDLFLDSENFQTIRHQEFFKNYVHYIKFKPTFQAFGLGQYYLYIRSSKFEEFDVRHLLINTFQKVKYPAFIDNTQSFFIKYIFPHRNPNMAHINWLTHSKRAISEYCLFFVKKVHQLFHLDYNISSNWDMDHNRFKAYMQRILFNPTYKVQISPKKEFNIGDLIISDYWGPDSSYFKDLTQIYTTSSKDIKFIPHRSLLEGIKTLIKKQLIWPYIKLKKQNLDLREKICIILPDVKQEHISTLIKIFSFFNFGFIYEIEGHYYVNGFYKEKKFENGLSIKLYLPNCEISIFQQLFKKLFQYLKIKKFLIMSDMIDGRNFLESTFDNLKFLKTYNPLKNLEWSEKDKKWINFKLYGERFKKNHPKLY